MKCRAGLISSLYHQGTAYYMADKVGNITGLNSLKTMSIGNLNYQWNTKTNHCYAAIKKTQ